MADDFRVTYGIEDGYAGEDRPQHCSISVGDFDSDDSTKELKAIFWDTIERDFNRKCSTYSDMEDEFLEWAQQKQAEMKAEKSSDAH